MNGWRPVALLMTFIACAEPAGPPTEPVAASPPGAPTPPAAPHVPDRLVVGVKGSIPSVDPVLTESEALETNARISAPMLSHELSCSLQFSPGLILAWHRTDDGKVISTVIDPRATWSDGQPVVSADVAALQARLTEKAGAPPLLSGPPEPIGDRVLIWRFRQASDLSEQLLSIGALMMSTRDFTPTGPTTGAWRLLAPPTPQGWTLVPSPNGDTISGERPALCAVDFRVITDPTTRLMALVDGEIDMVADLDVSDIAKLQQLAPEVKVVKRPPRTVEFVAWNHTRHPALADREVRRALARAVDIEGMIADLLTGPDGERYAEPAFGTVSPALCGTAHPALHLAGPDSGAAAAALEAAGWRDGDADGVREKNGVKLSFSLLINQGNARRTRAGDHLRRAFKEIGVDLKPEVVPLVDHQRRVATLDYDAAIYGLIAKLWIDPTTQWRTTMPDHNPAKFNVSRWGNPATDALVDAVTAAPDAASKLSAWHTLQAAIYDDQPVLFLWWNHLPVAIHERFTNTTIDAISPYSHLERWDVVPGTTKRACAATP
jgi:peptide/nickel transport system substrate-binding protein